MNPKIKRILQNILLLCASAILCVLLFESTIRFFISPSLQCYGILFGHIKLPPFTLKINNWDDPPANSPIADGDKITHGDIGGVIKFDPVLGYAPKENFTSRNGWVKLNNLGARSSADITKNIPSGKQRVIIFGDTFTFSRGIPEKNTWPSLLNDKSTAVEFFNFGVGGYSMGQCLLRYENIRNKVDYDTVMLVFDPTWDLCREINDLRQLVTYWHTEFLMPRFIIENNQLKLIKIPYATSGEFLRENKDQFSAQLKEYLRTYDRFYFRAKYESPFLVGHFILYKLLAKAIYLYQSESLRHDLLSPKSEAMEITLRIFERMSADAKQDRKRLVLVILPINWDILMRNNNSEFEQHYDEIASSSEIVSSLEKKGIICINLVKELSGISPKQFDRSYEGAHYGPKTNKMISEILWRKLEELKIIKKY